MFKPAVKYEAKGRVSLIGPAGSGKSMSSLILARLLAGPEGKIACVDTEHGSLSKYAGEPIPGMPGEVFKFDVMELDSFSPDNFMKALKAAEDGGYKVFDCDSLSHFWTGKDGALEFVDMAAKRHKDNMGGWKEFRPHERAMVDAMIASPLHVITTMRTKTDYQEQTDERTGKKKRVKIGLAPVQREGLEYEFDLVGYMDEENTLIVDKTRCSFYSKKAFTAPGPKDFQPFVDWLKGAAAPPKAEPKTDTPPAAAAPKAAPKPPEKLQGVFNVSVVTPYDKPNGGGKAWKIMAYDADGPTEMKTDNPAFATMADVALKEGLALNVGYDAYANGSVITKMEPMPKAAAPAKELVA
jgi:energy-coupling factor transporter ATP-binding protein EcfA2